MFRLLILTCLAAAGFASLAAPRPALAQGTAAPVIVMNINGELAQPMLEYLRRGLQAAEQNGAGMILLNLNTPGGQVTLMSNLVQVLRSSPVPLVVYVNPRGAMAASAGTLITLAGDLSAMAPQTTIGSASPVGAQGANIDSVEERKVKETMRALARSLTQDRPEAATTLAEDMIENAKAVSAEEALQIGLVDYIAADRQDLLNQLDGRTLQTPAGNFTLQTRDAQLIPVGHTLIETLLLTLTNPNVVFLLLTIGVQAILIELSSPGGWVAGFIGVVSLALAVYGLGILPVNYFGLAFLIIAFVLFLLDIKAPTHGALTAAGLASFITGALVLFNSPGVPSFQRVSVPLVVLMGLITAAVFAVIVSFGIRAQRRPAQMEVKSLVGRQGIVRTALDPHGTVQLASELWSAELDPGDESAQSGSRVEVTAVEGFHLHVKKA
jgi:membrane-bound serine protease (ClpP class)